MAKLTVDGESCVRAQPIRFESRFVRALRVRASRASYVSWGLPITYVSFDQPLEEEAMPVTASSKREVRSNARGPFIPISGNRTRPLDPGSDEPRAAYPRALPGRLGVSTVFSGGLSSTRGSLPLAEA